ncbi:DUF1127 domain-containing protein [Bradyrhizobium zhanjiangense]|uniref:DUF1127 domain-containing protein n=1 Tax=Bradyrhizobium zhanjiangense TaxID=1325107 RepID=A0ABY0DRT0_9BRAD|nr:DUF1127 domain-containing protein [Bradyrhizobium zhanjiangense]RXG97659.1 DUF1127 domain-containing protein [Bradyrhizobium zhanjiangense]
MPPHQTIITSEAERDAAALRLDLPIALEKDTAGPAASSAQSVLGLLKQCWRAFQRRRQRQGLRVTLQELSDRELMDIGLTRAEIDYITSQRAIDTLRDRTTHLWSRGVM